MASQAYVTSEPKISASTKSSQLSPVNHSYLTSLFVGIPNKISNYKKKKTTKQNQNQQIAELNNFYKSIT